jgi:hypothetical protein
VFSLLPAAAAAVLQANLLRHYPVRPGHSLSTTDLEVETRLLS